MEGLLVMPFIMPLTLLSGFDGVEPMNETFAIRPSTELRGLGVAARRCGVSHTHLRKVLEGERKPSAELERKMRRMGLTPGQMAEKGGK